MIPKSLHQIWLGPRPAPLAWTETWREANPDLARIHVGWRAYGEQARVLSYAKVIRKHFTRVPERVLGPDGKPATEKTLGVLEPAPTEVSIARLIGREMNMLDRAGNDQPGLLRPHRRRRAAEARAERAPDRWRPDRRARHGLPTANGSEIPGHGSHLPGPMEPLHGGRG